MAINQHIISDLLVHEADMTFVAFQDQFDQAGPVAYDAWRPFIPGDQEYTKAVFRAAIISLGSIPSFNELALTVDVPDVFDRGLKTTSAAGVVAVTFARPFYAAPEVNATLKSGSIVAIPRVTNITTTGFDVDLVNTSNARVVGDVSWAAKGY